MNLSRVLLLTLLWPLSASAQSSISNTVKRPLPPWPPAIGSIRVIIDTDEANEVDDQWAIALALGFPERLKIEGFVAAHYGQRGGANGIAKSRSSLEAMLEAASQAGRYVIKDGSDPFTYRDRIPEYEGVDLIVKTARTATPENPLWLILLGPATDGAAALLKDPTIADRVVIFWHGRSDWPTKCANFNAQNDLLAAQLLFELPCRFVLFDTGAELTMPMEESGNRVGSQGKLGEFLHEIRKRSAYASRADKGIFDLGDIATIIDPDGTSQWEMTTVPSVNYDYKYDFEHSNGQLTRISTIDREACFLLLDQALKRLSHPPSSSDP